MKWYNRNQLGRARDLAEVVPAAAAVAHGPWPMFSPGDFDVLVYLSHCRCCGEVAVDLNSNYPCAVVAPLFGVFFDTAATSACTLPAADRKKTTIVCNPGLLQNCILIHMRTLTLGTASP